eukprot:Protomagalhaensia_sp_Gyna_25__1144@NODE_1562_length_1729_cov_8_608876_g1269_i0_p2_GENE_NODE_1562_length_1729_cov_8_608876_g1269_i0NODE_1562_length_1729_cov_8_608876_g1269_i0_p2_ORF_typecomplete_len151_score17_70_NODE_1562_length_1729_cov_8_608876_g1269_i043453
MRDPVALKSKSSKATDVIQSEIKEPNPWDLDFKLQEPTSSVEAPVPKDEVVGQRRRASTWLKHRSAWHSQSETTIGEDDSLQHQIADTTVKAAVAHTKHGTWLLKFTRNKWQKVHRCTSLKCVFLSATSAFLPNQL